MASVNMNTEPSGTQLEQSRNERLQECISRVSQVKQHLEEGMARIGIVLPPIEANVKVTEAQEDNLLNTLNRLPAEIINTCDEIHHLISMIDQNIL